MKTAPKKIEFQAFKDGICDIYTEDDEGEKKYKYRNIAFDKRILGYKRFWAAAANQEQINSVIRIPKVPGTVDTYDTVEIKNGEKYYIKLVQEIFNTNPLSIDLTLQHV